MQSFKRFVKSSTTLLARVVLSRPRLRQAVLSTLDMLPDGVETRLRSIISPPRQAQDLPLVTLQWPYSSLAASERQVYHALLRRRAHRPDSDPADPRPRLAYFSPMPPERSGISNYSLMLIPRLAAHYRIDIIVHQEHTALPWPDDEYPVRDLAWFRAHAPEFDRILYHVGNAPFHDHMFELLEEWPGAVMLHDFFLGHLVAHIDVTNPGYLARSLYEGWGYGPLADLREPRTKEQIIWDYPLNAAVLRHALGMIVHSPFSTDLAREHFGSGCRQQWHVIPHLKEPARTSGRAEARRTLGLDENSFVVCSFGHITPTKCHDRLAEAWFSSALAQDENCVLIFVGEKPTGSDGNTLLRKIRDHSRGKAIHITGWADGDTFEHYLQAADVAVQLRSQSRGETSGAVIDCMNHGLATIVNAHGTMADLPADSVLLLEDRFATSSLRDALEHLWRDAEARRVLGERALATIRSLHDPQACALQYRDAIESIHHNSEAQLGEKLDRALADAPVPDSAQMVEMAQSIARIWTPPLRARHLLVDVSAIARTDLKTGIERVVRAQLLELLRQPPEGWHIEPVYLDCVDGSWQYRYARGYTCQLLECEPLVLADDKVAFGDGDILYMPDLFPHGTIAAHQQGLFDDIRARGVIVNVLVHDLLPVTLPQHFPSGAADNHQRWLHAIGNFADRLICISQAVAAELREWAAQQGVVLPALAINHHGADIAASRPRSDQQRLPREARKVLAQLVQVPTFLMVGTIEPRKGHLQALAAFDLLWQRGIAVNLVIVGKEGWKDLPATERRTIAQTTRHMDLHPRRNKSLFWLAEISDDYLDALYRASQCLLAASENEGFGLPLIEAALHGMPVLARDIPVFREVAGDHASYFRGEHPEDLADAIADWLSRHASGNMAPPVAFDVNTWARNVADLKAILLS